MGASVGRGVVGSALRWIAVLPTGLLAVILIMFPVHWVILLGTALYSEDLGIWMVPPRILERLVQGFVVTSGIVYFGALMAPSHTFVTAVVLSIMVVTGIVAAFVLTQIEFKFALDYSGFEWIEYGVLIGLQITGIAAGLGGAKQAQHDNGS